MRVERKIVALNLLQKHPVKEEKFDIGNIRFSILEHSIGWNFDAAEAIIKSYDGYADGFALIGIPKHLGYGKLQFRHPGYLRLLRVATKTSVYVADDLRDFFSEWTLKRVLAEQPQLFFGKKVLFQCGMVSPLLPSIASGCSSIIAADPIYLSGSKWVLKSERQVNLFLKMIRPLMNHLLYRLVNPEICSDHDRIERVLKFWLKRSDVFVCFGGMLAAFSSFQEFKGKILIVDHLDIQTRKRIESANVAQIIECFPDAMALQMPKIPHFSVLGAIIDQSRLYDKSTSGFSEYVLKWMERTQIGPRALKSNKGIQRRCAFIIHPLNQRDLWKVGAIRKFQHAPLTVRGAVEKGAALIPCFFLGQLTGAVSEATGQEVICDFYGLPATPKQVLSMKEEFLYKRLVQCAELARRNGAGIIGLGAYTKVVGDAGVTVARRSPIPVTNGNSYSASTTLWAARQMVEKLGLISPEKIGNRFKAKAMIIGATGSIGRVSSLLMSLVFNEIVLVANRADKLLELRSEILKSSPDVRVTVSTQANSEIMDSDLIVTATSNQGGSILDIMRVKPGAVICDCSRPLDVGKEEAKKRPDVMVIESGEVILPGDIKLNVDLGIPFPSVYACTAETVLLAMEGRFENYSLSKRLSMEKTKEIYKLGVKHGARLSAVQGPYGVITDEQIDRVRTIAKDRLKKWSIESGIINHAIPIRSYYG